MAKNIVILFDGTSNEINADRTNILRLYGTLTKSKDQLVYYDPGVGTLGNENAWSQFSRYASRLMGMLTGWGLDANVKEAYRFLVENYARDADGTRDRIYILGFSRGAYSARVLAGFIHAFGLIEPRSLNLLDYAYRAYKRIGEANAADAFAEMQLFEKILQTDRPQIRALGLFDTVSSVIESGRFLPRLRRHYAFTSNNASVESVRHAVALCERRVGFRPLSWPEDQIYSANRYNTKNAVPQDVSEVWFRGVHCDIGGGYPETESGLAKLPLAWMIDETQPLGLVYNPTLVNRLVHGSDGKHTPPDAKAARHESLTRWWKLLEYIPRLKQRGSKRRDFRGWILPLGEQRCVPAGARIHSSVAQSGQTLTNLPADPRTED